MTYSISDPNIQTILSEIIRCLDNERLSMLGDRLIFVEYNQAEVPPQVGPHSRQIGGRDLRLTRVIAHDYTPVFRALAERKRHLNAKLVRQVKEEMYELVRANDPRDKLHVLDIEDLDEYDDVEIVVGVGILQSIGDRGLIGFSIDDLFEDLITNGHEFDSRALGVVNKTIRKWLVGNRKYTPLYKHLSRAGLLDAETKPMGEEVPPKVLEIARLPRSTYTYNGLRTQSTIDGYRDQTVEQIAEENDPISASRYITYIEDPDVEAIGSFLEENIDLLDQTDFRKLACIYDRLKYGPGFGVFE